MSAIRQMSVRSVAIAGIKETEGERRLSVNRNAESVEELELCTVELKGKICSGFLFFLY
jgi:hypothetical protein